MFSCDRNKSIPAIVSIWKILIYFIYPHSIVWVQLACHWFLRSRICVSLNAFFHSQWGWIWWTNLIDVRLNSSGLMTYILKYKILYFHNHLIEIGFQRSIQLYTVYMAVFNQVCCPPLPSILCNVQFVHVQYIVV